MRLAQLTVAALIVGTTFVACRKDTNLPGSKNQTVTATEKANENSVSEIFNRYNKATTRTYKINAAEGGQVETPEGIIVTVAGGSLLRPDGTPEEGMVAIRIKPVLTVAAAAASGTPPQSTPSQEGGGGPIVTGGAVNVDITNEAGEQLTSEDGGVTVEIPAPEGFDEEMSLWEGEPNPDQPEINAWEETEDPVTPGDNGDTFKFIWEKSGNYNIDKAQSCGGPLTGYRVTVTGSNTPAFNDNNTVVYAITPACNAPINVIFSLTQYNASPSFWFMLPPGDLPVGATVTYVSISNVGGVYYLGNATVTLTPSMTINITNATPTSLGAILSYLSIF